MDLFADTPDAAPPAEQLAALPKPTPAYARLLESAMADAGRKAVFKGLDVELKDRLTVALEVVARAKRAAYDRAVAGEFLSSFDWLARQPALAAATALLHSAFIDTSAIPMVETHASA